MSQPEPHPPGWDDLPKTTRPAFQALWQRNQELTGQVAYLQAEVDALRHRTNESRLAGWLFKPWGMLAVSLGAALVFAGLVILDHELSLTGDRHRFFLIYMVPIGAPFVAFLLDRTSRWSEISAYQWAIDLPVIVLSFARALYAVPFISGHALFLTYALLTANSRVTKVLSMIVLAEVIYLKIFVWHDPTLWGGLLVGTAAAMLFYIVRKARSAAPSNAL